MKKIILALTACSLLTNVYSQTYVISTVAGGASISGSYADSVKLDYVCGAALDAAGNLYIAAQNIYKISPAGIITSIAGAGDVVAGADGGLAVNTPLAEPEGVAFDASGNMYIAETWSGRVRKVDTKGIITTVAGRDDTLPGYNGDNIPATAATLNEPTDVTVDKAGNLYICDWVNNRIRKVNTNGIITTYAGNGTAGFSGDSSLATAAALNGPMAIALDKKGMLYIVDQLNGRIRMVNTNGIITNVAGANTNTGYSGDGGPATAASMNNPLGVAVDSLGRIYIADNGNDVVRMVDTNGIISTFAGLYGATSYGGDGGPATAAGLSGPTRIAIDRSQNIYITDQYWGEVRKVDTKGIIASVAGFEGLAGDGKPALQAQLYLPTDVITDKKGNMVIADEGEDLVRRVNKAGIINTIAGFWIGDYDGLSGLGDTLFINTPQSVREDSIGNVYFTDDGNNLIRKIDTLDNVTTLAGQGPYGSGFSGDGGPATAAQISSPLGIALDKKGNIYFADGGNSRIREINTAGVINTVVGNGTGGYSGDNGPATAAEINDPQMITLDAKENLYIADSWNNRVRKVSTSGIITTVAGNGDNTSMPVNGALATASCVSWPEGVALDSIGNLYITDGYYAQLYKVDTNGIITTIISDKYAGEYSGDGGPADSAGTNLAEGINVDSKGNIYIADYYNNVIRKLTYEPYIPGIIHGKTALCKNATSATYYVNSAKGALSYTWTLPTGWSGSSTDTAITVTSGTTGGPISVVANGPHGTASPAKTLMLYIDVPALSISPSSPTMCNGGIPLSLKVINAGQCTWAPATGLSASTGEVVYANPVTTTTYTITGTDTAGCAASDSVTVTITPSNGFDLTGNLNVCIDTPSFSNASIQACIFNNRCTSVNGTIKLVIDTAIHITNIISDSTAHISGDTLIWNYDSLYDKGKTHCVSLTGKVDSLHATDSVFVSMFITPVTGDSVPANNSVTYWVKPFPYNCVGIPFDPNEKSVYPEGDIADTQLLTYTIHFQNTGTAPAKNVVVLDTISPYLDITTLNTVSSSHEVALTVLPGNIAKFTFSNINLPDTATSKTTSIGVFKYTVKPLYSDAIGVVIYNTAGIYFDANPVVKTNRTVNIIRSKPLSVLNLSNVLNIAVFPNPFTTITSVVFNTDGTHYLELDDITGRRIENIVCTGKQYELSRNGLAQGIYFVRAYDEGMKYVATAKVVVQ